ncbi:histidine phosphatase superfamily-domain-containing protein [Powellomyces hirtus]|nr:histidine phosphatase superfamily-domain-containing protein [Powellomyces hirtus]
MSVPDVVSAVKPKWVIGVCAMDTKARSKPMRNILNRLLSSGDFEAVIFGDKVILDEEVENWPSCDFLISFFSNGFPLEKAIDYVRLRRPFCVNDLPMQQLIWDRRLVLRILDKIGIPTPRRLRTHTGDEPVISPENRDRLKKLDIEPPEGPQPLVEAEMVDADTIKIGDQIIKKPFVEKPVSGENHNVYIYYSKAMGGGVRRLFRKVGNKSSEFCPDVVDIRRDGSYIYEEFMNVDNAEDVKVYTVGDRYTHAETRKSPVVDGVVRRNAEGKEVRYITALTPEEKEMAKRITVAFGQTVCGFDLLRANGKSYVIDVNGWSFVKGNDDYYDKCSYTLRQVFLEHAATAQPANMHKELSIENQWKLKAFLSVMRHADRTPKQKMKFSFVSKPFMDLLNGQEGEVVFKKQEQLDRVTAAARNALANQLEDVAVLNQLLEIMDAKSHLSGTKAQIKPQFKKKEKLLDKVQLVVKWGGEFTHGGRHQTKEIGENYRKDLMIINKELLDDVKIYSSSEQRVTATADFFVRSFLQLSEVPDDYTIVSKEMLDDSNAVKEQTENVKWRLQEILNSDTGVKLDDDGKAKADPPTFVEDTIKLLRILRTVMRDNFQKMDVDIIQRRWCCAETPGLFKERWEKLMRDFCDVERKSFDPSKISELYDSLKYDLIHNRDFCLTIFSSTEHNGDLLKQLYHKSKVMFDFIAPKEYGIEDEEKLEIGVLSSVALLRQLVADLQAARSSPKPSARFYFTKESKIISLLNIVLLCGLPTRVDKVEELDYLTQITFELYERGRGLGMDYSEAREFSLRIGFSQGAHNSNLIDLSLDSKHSLSVKPRIWISDHVSLDDALSFLTPRMSASPTPSTPK